MSIVFGLLPLLVLLFLAGTLIRAGWLLALRPLHPHRILLLSLSSASILAVLGLAQLLPAALWWVTWLVALGLVVAVALACRRALAPADAADAVATEALPPRRRRLLEAPSRASLIGEVVLVIVLLGLAVYAG